MAFDLTGTRYASWVRRFLGWLIEISPIDCTAVSKMQSKYLTSSSQARAFGSRLYPQRRVKTVSKVIFLWGRIIDAKPKLNPEIQGIISSVAFCPDYSGTYAVSSLNSSPNSSLALFSEGTGGEVLKFCGGVKPGGLTQVKIGALRTMFSCSHYFTRSNSTLFVRISSTPHLAGHRISNRGICGIPLFPLTSTFETEIRTRR
jgi:hypothetical protein